MFTDIEKKLKGVAIVNFICGIVIALACLIIMEEAGILIAPAALLTSLISSWFIYAFAELLENTKRISHALQVVFAEDISKDLERQKKDWKFEGFASPEAPPHSPLAPASDLPDRQSRERDS